MNKPSNVVRLKSNKSENANITQRIVNASTKRKHEYFIRDNNLKGFFLRVKPTGVKSFGVQARLQGKGRPIQRIIGTKDRFTLQEARLKAKEWLQLISDGKDPKETSHDKVTPMDLLNRYISHKSLEPTTIKGYLFNFEKYLNKYKDKPCNEISSEMLISWYDKEKELYPISIERTFVTLKTVMRFGKTLKLIDEDPTEITAQVVQRPKEVKKVQRLRRIYNDLDKFIGGFLTAEISEVMRDWMVLVLTTGMRKAESMTITWDQVDMNEKILVIPKNKAKRFLIIPMVGLTYDMFQKRKNDPKKDQTYVFNSSIGKPINDPRKALERICKESQIETYAPHDLRRVFASVCHELNISEDEIGQLLNHSSKTVTDLYINRSVKKVRGWYQKIIDYMDRKIVFEDVEGQGFQIKSATDLMRSTFYKKVAPSPDQPIAKQELQEDEMREAEYWEGTEQIDKYL